MAALTAALAATTIAKTATDYMGQRRAANASVAQGNYEQGVYNLNASYADQQATDAVRLGTEQAQKVQEQTKLLTGSQRASLSAQGIDPNVGSGEELQAEGQQLGALDQITIRNNAAREAYGYNIESQGYRNQGAFAAAAGQNRAQGYRNQSTQTLLSGGLQLAQLYGNNSMKAPGNVKTVPVKDPKWLTPPDPGKVTNIGGG